DAQVARDGEERDLVVVRVGVDDHDRVRAADVALAALGAVVYAEHEDVARVRDHHPVLRRESALGARVELLVRLLDPATEGEEAEQRPDEREHDQADERPEDRAGPAPPGLGGLRAAVVAGICSFGLPRLGVAFRRLGPDRPLYSPPAVHTVRLVLGRHASDYRSRSRWLPPALSRSTLGERSCSRGSW